MSKRLVSTLQVSFDGDDDGDGLGDNAGKYRIVLQQRTRRLDPWNRLEAGVYTTGEFKVEVTVGSVERGPSYEIPIREALKFSNSSSANLKYPNAFSVSITPKVMLMEKRDSNNRRTIVPATGVTYKFDADKAAVVATKPSGPLALGNVKDVEVKVYGVVFVSYTATLRILYYKPNLDGQNFGGEVVLSLGTIYAYHDYDVATQEMEVDPDNDDPTYVEYARVYSKIVLDTDGAWEAPPGWPENTTYPIAGVGPPGGLDPDNSFTDERVHEIIYVYTSGRLDYERFSTNLLRPYVGTFNYNPEYFIRFGSPPTATSDPKEEWILTQQGKTWGSVFLDVNKDQILSSITSRYPGAVEGG